MKESVDKCTKKQRYSLKSDSMKSPICTILQDKKDSWSATGGNRRTQPARTPVRCAIDIGMMVLATDAQGHPEW